MARTITSLNRRGKGGDASEERDPLLGAVSHISTDDVNPSQRDDSKDVNRELGTKSLTLIMCSVWIGTFCAGLGRIPLKAFLPQNISAK